MLPKTPARRLHILLWVLVLWAGILGGRLIWLQGIQHEYWAAKAERQQRRLVALSAPRGAILDRTGQPLAMTLEADSVALDPSKVDDPERVAVRLARALGVKAEVLLKRLKAARDSKLRFLWVARQLTQEESRRVRLLRVESLWLRKGSAYVNPQKVEKPDLAAEALAAALGRDAGELHQELLTQRDAGMRQILLAKDLTSRQERALQDLIFPGLEFRKEMRRYYPRTTLAAHVVGWLGFTDPLDPEAHGTGGVEQSFEKDLRGQAGEAQVFADSDQGVYDEIVLREPVPGADITLTIDPNVQFRAEQELAAAAVASGANSGSVVAMDPYTGDILAMASYPRFDREAKISDPKEVLLRQPQAVSRGFEPGSVFKVITLAAALERTQLTPRSLIDCGNGQINLFGRVIRDHDRYSTLSMAGVLAHSSNVGAIRIALATGNESFYEYQQRFGFGKKTGIPIPGEAPGVLNPPKTWSKSSIGSLAMGHELVVTALQLARAGAAVANGGLLVTPRLVHSRQRKDQELEVFAAPPGDRILRPETAVQLQQMMEGVVLDGTGRRAVLQGYTSGGKTGSAQIYDPTTKTYTHTYNASFLGFAPVSNPRVVVVVALHGTSGGSTGYGGARAAPVFREVTLSALRTLEVPKDLPDRVRLTNVPGKVESDLAAAGPDDGAVIAAAAALASEDETSPDFAYNTAVVRSQNKTAPGADAARPSELAYGETVRVRAVSSVTQPLAHGGTPASAGDPSMGQRPFLKEDQRPFLKEDQRPLLKEDQPPSSREDQRPAVGGSVPDFRGKTLRAVLQESAAAGVRVEWSGSGLAARQDPSPGAILRPGAAVKVQFGK